MKKIRIVQVGTLHDHAIATMDSLRRLSDIFEVVGVVPDDERLSKHAVYNNVPVLTFDQLLARDDVDAVAVESYELTSVEFAQKCIDKGLHVHLDKPGGESDQAFTKLAATAKKKHLCLQMGYMYRYNPEIIKLKQNIAQGKLGKVYCVETHMDCEHLADKRRWLGNFKGGMMFFLGCHLVDLVVGIMGVPQKIIPYNRATGIEGVADSLDYGLALFEYPQGFSFCKTCAAEINGFNRRQLVVCGERGTVELKPLEYFCPQNKEKPQVTTTTEVYMDKTHLDWNDHRTTYTTPPYNRYDDMMTDFARIVRGEKQNDYSYEYEVFVQRCVLAACGFDVDFASPVVLD